MDCYLLTADRLVANPRRFGAAIFDMDGVVTDTASLHARAWKQLFDAYLARRGGDEARPFDPVSDYQRYVDGRLRQEGVRCFLASRGLEVPTGAPDDPESAETAFGLGQRKNRLFLEALAQQGVATYDGTRRLIAALRRQGVRTGVVSASRNCARILQRGGIESLFDARVDGLEYARLALAGKPAPDGFLECAKRLGTAPARAMVVEDALAGVVAARAGGFGLVVGVARHENADALRHAGAHVVVDDLAHLSVEHINACFAH